jgi:hypothetical protein
MAQVIPLRSIALAGISMWALSACDKLGFGQDEMTWARAALERNDRIEIVAVDQKTHAFMIRLKDSGELQMLPVSEIIAGPRGAPAAASPRGVAQNVGASDPSAASAAAAGQSAAAGGSQAGADATVAGTAAPGYAAAPAATGYTAAPAGPGAMTPATAVVAGPAGAGPAGPAGPAGLDGATPGPVAADRPRIAVITHSVPGAIDATAEMPGGRVLAEGPGYTIKAASRNFTRGARPQHEVTATSAPLERRHEPIICQGSRMLQIDNRNLEFDGDAVAAEDGCEIHITNSRISAKGTGVLARGANVHIENSEIEGELAAVEAAEGAQIYAHSSKFYGLSRRLDTASFNDLGGNVWN